jgi:uncharacterized Zn-binding protein involved in type VI secretion
MGKPAARMGDTANTCNDPADMPVGKVIAVGTVLINKMPAAKQNDQIVGVDTHIIMIPAPPGPPIPTPLPHPFAGMITSACSTSVKIMGMPAATVDSMADNMPPHIPQGGPFQKPPTNKAKIIMGSPDVFIGNGGGGGGGGASGEKKVDAKSEAKEVEKGHYLDVKFVDKGGKPITGVNYDVKGPSNEIMRGPLTGQVKKTGVKEGSHEIALRAITKVEWSKTEAKVGDKVTLKVVTAGIDDGESVDFMIFIKDANFPDTVLDNLTAKVKSDKIEADWELQIDEKLLKVQDGRHGKHYSAPTFYYVVEAAGLRQRSGTLRYKDWMELQLDGEDGKPLANAGYTLHMPDGSVRKGKLDKDGYAKEENLPPGRIDVDFDPRESSGQ